MDDQQLQNKLRELISLPGETEVVEFKEAKNAEAIAKGKEKLIINLNNNKMIID